MENGRLIKIDLKCRGCGYNLRNLPVGHNCPECGRPAPAGVATFYDLHQKLVIRRKRSEATAAKIPCSVDALHLVYDSYLIAKKRSPRALLSGKELVSAADICDAFCSLVRNYFYSNEEAIALLTSWGISTSEDVG